MENCLYQGKVICTFDLKDEDGFYYEDLVLHWKEEATKRALTCIECGEPVYLAAGPIKEPYFAHYDLEECEYGNGHESEELKKGKRLLYQIAKKSFLNHDIYARYRMENGMYSTIHCKHSKGMAIAFDYRLLNNSLDKFRLRDNYYLEHNIMPIYVMGIRQQKDTKQIDWYQSLIQSAMGYLIFLDTKKESIILKKSFSYRMGRERKFTYYIKEYQVKEISFDPIGLINCDFWDGCKEIELKITKEKEHYEKKREEQNRLRVFYQEMQDKENLRMEAYRRNQLANNNREDEKELKFVLEEKDYYDVKHPVINVVQQETLNTQTGLSNINQNNDLNPVILEKCKKMIEEGNGHLVSKKYYDFIMGIDG